jgi:3-deoxy-D-manno-octulosonic-acid transferase
MQEPSHVRRIVEMGAPPARVRALGNLKFDALEPAQISDDLSRLFADGHAGPTWVAGSTVAGEEELVLRAFRQVREAVPDARLVLAPRHPERFGAVPALVEAAGFRCARRSISESGWDGAEVLLLDTLGELASVYPVATAVFVGGSLVPAGGHNVLEAAVAGKAIVVGPHMENFQEIADRFRDEGGMIQVATAEDLAPEVISLLTDVTRRRSVGTRAQELIEASRGALRETVEALVALVGEA